MFRVVFVSHPDTMAVSDGSTPQVSLILGKDGSGRDLTLLDGGSQEVRQVGFEPTTFGFWVRDSGRREPALQGIGRSNGPARRPGSLEGGLDVPCPSRRMQVTSHRTPDPNRSSRLAGAAGSGSSVRGPRASLAGIFPMGIGSAACSRLTKKSCKAVTPGVAAMSIE